MNQYPIYGHNTEPTRKELWIAAFTAVLARVEPVEAVKQADEALRLCDDRWRQPEWVPTWQYTHNYPIGHAFKKSEMPEGVIPETTA